MLGDRVSDLTVLLPAELLVRWLESWEGGDESDLASGVGAAQCGLGH